MASFLGQKNLARGVRNNNPLNLRISANNWKGKIPKAKNTDKSFEQFERVEDGIRAGVIDMYGDIVKDKFNTMNKLIGSFAPPSENNTAKYVSDTATAVGIMPDAIITPSMDFFAKLVPAMIRKENGIDGNLITSKSILDGITAAFNYLGVNGQAVKKNDSQSQITTILLYIAIAVLAIYLIKNLKHIQS